LKGKVLSLCLCDNRPHHHHHLLKTRRRRRQQPLDNQQEMVALAKSPAFAQ
jgi:hypothetical protein